MAVSDNDIRIAYIVSAYQQPELLIRVIRRLHAPDHGFFIHYDLRSPDKEFEQVKRGLAEFSNVVFLPRHKCRWGDFGHVLASLKGIDEIARQGFVHDYAVLLTGQDYPLKSDRQIRARLRDAAGMSFMENEAWPIADLDYGRAIKRIENFHVHLPFPRWTRSLGWPVTMQHIAFPARRKIPCNHHPYFGASYWYLHRSCIEEIHRFVAAHPEYPEFFKHVLIPDESFFPTLLMNSELAGTIVPRTLTHVVWRPPWPGILTSDDLPVLRESDCLLARKFAPAVDARVLDELDLLIDSVPAAGQAGPEQMGAT